MSAVLTKTSIPGLLKDKKTGVVINTNTTELERYNIEKNRILDQQMINKKVDELTNTVNELKEILKLMVKNNGISTK